MMMIRTASRHKFTSCTKRAMFRLQEGIRRKFSGAFFQKPVFLTGQHGSPIYHSLKILALKLAFYKRIEYNLATLMNL